MLFGESVHSDRFRLDIQETQLSTPVEKSSFGYTSKLHSFQLSSSTKSLNNILFDEYDNKLESAKSIRTTEKQIQSYNLNFLCQEISGSVSLICSKKLSDDEKDTLSVIVSAIGM